MKDNRVQGRSYGYVMIPDGGLKLAGVTFAAGPRAAGKGERGGWYKLLVDAGCQTITQAEYEDELKHGASPSAQPAGTGQERKYDRTGHDSADLPATRNRKSNRRPNRKRGRLPVGDRGASPSPDGVPGN